MTKYIRDFIIEDNIRLNTEYFILNIRSEEALPDMYPGQFVEIKVENTDGVFLRRPISIYGIDREKQTINLLIQKAGKGTTKLAQHKQGDKLNIIFPLGNSFTAPERKGKVLLVGGGVGVAPLPFLAEYLVDKGMEVEFLLGFRNSDLLVDLKNFEKYGKVNLSTDNGTAGEKGTVMDNSVLKEELLPFVKVYTCGPNIMMKAVAAFVEARGIECEASLENTMACGIGACLCCIQETIHGNVRVCIEGPVFNTKELIW